MLVSVRELNIDGIPSPSWVNQHLVYTHGYGAVLTPSTGVAPDGNPDFRLNDLPPVGEPELQQPAIYYGQGVGGYAIVKTEQQEIDYTEADGTNHTTVYRGDGGVRMDSFVRQAALALRFGDMNPLISSFVTSGVAGHLRPQHRRAGAQGGAVPPLRQRPLPGHRRGQDPVDLRRLHDHQPLPLLPARPTRPGCRPPATSNANFNYVRNSVKVVIDAYNGKMTFYVIDAEDPIIKAYSKAFPELFTDGAWSTPSCGPTSATRRTSSGCRPTCSGSTTSPIRATSTTTPTPGTSPRSRASVGGAAPAGLQTAQRPGGPPVVAREERMEPYHLLMRLPDEEREDFLILQPFVPFSRDDSRKDLTAFMVAKSDPVALRAAGGVRHAPGQTRSTGPPWSTPASTRKPTSPGRSPCWAPGGSKVKLGNLLVIPINQSLIYIQPLYVEAEGTPLPQLKKVIVVYGDRVVMRDSLRESLTVLFGSSPPTLEQQGAGRAHRRRPPATPAARRLDAAARPPRPPSTPPSPASSSRPTPASPPPTRPSGRATWPPTRRELDAAKDLVKQASDAARPAAPAATTETTPTTRATA